MKSRAIEFVRPREIEIKTIDVGELTPEEILIKTRVCGICMREVHVYSGMLNRPMPVIMGHEPVGIVEAVGNNVRNFKPGDKVTALSDSSFSEYFKVDQTRAALISQTVSNYEFWLGEPVMCAVNCLRNAEVGPGDNIALIGCGFMGLILLQGLKKSLAHKVVVIDINKFNLELAEKIGCGKIIHTAGREAAEIAEEVFDFTGGKLDIAIEASGAPKTIALGSLLLRNGGRLIVFGHHVQEEIIDLNEWHLKGLAVLNIVPWYSKNLLKDFYDAVKLLNNRTICLDGLITHRHEFNSADEAFKLSLERKEGYVKGVLFPGENR